MSAASAGEGGAGPSGAPELAQPRGPAPGHPDLAGPTDPSSRLLSLAKGPAVIWDAGEADPSPRDDLAGAVEQVSRAGQDQKRDLSADPRPNSQIRSDQIRSDLTRPRPTRLGQTHALLTRPDLTHSDRAHADRAPDGLALGDLAPGQLGRPDLDDSSLPIGPVASAPLPIAARCLVWALAALALVASVALALILGPADIRASDVLPAVFGASGDAAMSPLRAAIIWELRLPRILTALAAGAGLALTGAVMQALTRNPLADPYLLGLSSGAALGAVLTLLAGATLLLPLGAFLGSLAALALALSIARMLGGVSPSRAILAGICISALASAATSGLIFWTATGDSYREILSWLMGSLAGSLWRDAGLALAALVLCAPVILTAARSLDAFAFGEVSAASLGVDVARLRWHLLLATALLTGVMVSLGGAIGFVGLVVPHVMRLVTGAGHRRLLPGAMLLGGLFLLWADTAARTIFAPRELPVGILTALVGAPIFFLVLLRYRRQI